jgi:hypothetical protein
VRSRRECLDIVKLSVWEDKRCDGTLRARYYQAALMWCSVEHDDVRCLVSDLQRGIRAVSYVQILVVC